MKLICELTEGVKPVLEEGSDGVKTMYVVGPAIVAEKANKNNRIYRIDTVRGEIKRYVTELVETNRALGELGHPAQSPAINLDKSSHLFTSIVEDNNKQFIAKAKLLETPMGKIAKTLINEGVTLGFSSRGMGSLKALSDGIMEVQNDFRLATAADLVADPSAPGAFVRGIMENIEWYYDAASGTWIQERVEHIQKSIKNMNIRQINENKERIFENFIKGLSKKKFV